jgi:mono/diheme cytochrome c family protein
MILRTLSVLAALVAPISVSAQDAGLDAYNSRCAACHLPDREGVPGAFPPLTQEPRRLAGSEQGRRYLILVVAKGLVGQISVGGATFRGVMPPQMLDDAGIANVLNHLAGCAAGGDGPDPFTAAEVASVRAGAASLTSAQVAVLRPR